MHTAADITRNRYGLPTTDRTCEFQSAGNRLGTRYIERSMSCHINIDDTPRGNRGVFIGEASVARDEHATTQIRGKATNPFRMFGQIDRDRADPERREVRCLIEVSVSRDVE